MSFFPCTRFSSKVPVLFRGLSPQQKTWDEIKKLQYSITLHDELHRNFVLICKMAHIAYKKKLRMIIENPYDHAHYLTMYWCIKPSLVDKDRTERGDMFKKPTQYYFINCQPKYNIIMEPFDYVETGFIKYIHAENGKSRQTVRSEIHPQYANRFIREFILDAN